MTSSSKRPIYTLSDCTAEDLPIIAEIFLSSFCDDFFQHIFPRQSNTAGPTYDWLSSSEEDNIVSPYWKFLKVSPADQPDLVVSYAKWGIPIHGKSEIPEFKDISWPSVSPKELCDEFFNGLQAGRKRLMRDRPHYYLEILGTRPEWQGKGAASALLKWGLDKADEDGLETYIEGTDDGLPIYEHYGWVTQASYTIEGHTTELMIRPPKKL